MFILTSTHAYILHECGFVTGSGKSLKHKVVYPYYFEQFLVNFDLLFAVSSKNLGAVFVVLFLCDK